ncbi:MAG TPA: class A beta-lactamase [Allosphingosinicella sp.]|nr:class A beta-lactamase [Allosphingosinicella sp.]
MLDRRTLLLGFASLPIAAPALAQVEGAREAFTTLRARLGPGGRLGVAAMDSAGRTLFDADSRYAMCSTFKLPLAAAMLAGAEGGRWRMSEELAFGEADLLDYAPVVRANLAAGRLSIEALCAAIVEVSDNSAANILLRKLGGPAALTDYVRNHGDRETRLDRIEPELNSNVTGDPRDTTTPAAMLRLTRSILFGELLSQPNRVKLATWMARSSTGRDRLRAGLPASWRLGDKTGTGANGAHNDVLFALPPGQPPLVIACFISGGDAPDAVRAQVHAAVARFVATGAL